ncbi:hypothetical protein D7030_12950 [Flavobacteriaceae bacterium AU392]|nr:hypothetical protein D1817_05540 [Flavobacteriaceae bacterium]RKM81213.1 hypothetical protein D7030_12950 [Flavobacteriaceae bacterium AU392]
MKYKPAKQIILKQYKKDSSKIHYSIFIGKTYAINFEKDSALFWLNKAQKLFNNKTPKNQLFQYYLWKGYLHEVNKDYGKALENYFDAKNISRIKIDPYYINLLYQRVLLIYSENKYKEKIEDWIEVYTKIKDSLKNDYFSNSYHNTLGKHYHYNGNGEKALKEFEQNIRLSNKTNNKVMLINALLHKGLIYAEYNRIQDSARYYYTKAIKICACPNNILLQATNIYNISRTYLYENNLKKTKEWLYKLDSLKKDLPSRKLHITNNLYKDLYYIYKEEGEIDSTLHYLELHKTYSDSISKINESKNIAELQTKYEVSEKEKENIQLENNIEKTERRNKNLWIGSTLIIIFISIIAFLIQKNTKRKQKLAEQEKVLESQKLASVLKEQELTAIDAMIEGQEKERQRIANDLHDDLGGLMANVKLHFNALQDNESPDLFDKTNTLIEEAYQKVRTVAHAKNSGVIAKQGLLKAVQQMAKKVSASNKIQIDVVDHSLEHRLENSLELTIFRIIQELITNVIKHAEATETTIHLTNHNSTLNIMVEDNGKGFNPSQITKSKKGMGISSIDKRVEHLEGTLTIESEPNKGTTIIIDLPV